MDNKNRFYFRAVEKISFYFDKDARDEDKESEIVVIFDDVAVLNAGSHVGITRERFVEKLENEGLDEYQIETAVEVYDDNNFCCNEEYLVFEPTQIIQYIGKEDKNNKPIFEGDIIEIMHSNGKRAVVFWNDEKCCFDLKGEKVAYNAHLTIRKDYFEVVGNKFQNSEMVCQPKQQEQEQ